ncbi:MAG: TraX family protein [Oscillospiraceae bacterium]|nr:TraX family protein [Oscillospiraceae bacterium]MDD6145698.1 TraX family protein [Oscillospiraceae bacterium]
MKLTRNALKYIAVAAMLIDHIGLLFVPITTPLGTAMRVIGRFTAPTMCMLLAEGYSHTSSKAKYALRLLIFALISQFPYTYMLYGELRFDKFSMITTLFLCFVMLICTEKIKYTVLKALAVIVTIALSSRCDWGIVAPMWVLTFYFCRDSKAKTAVFYSLCCLFWLFRCMLNTVDQGRLWTEALWQAGVFSLLPVIFLYHGEPGKKNAFSKWFFYIFYPLHILILAYIFRH